MFRRYVSPPLSQVPAPAPAPRSLSGSSSPQAKLGVGCDSPGRPSGRRPAPSRAPHRALRTPSPEPPRGALQSPPPLPRALSGAATPPRPRRSELQAMGSGRVPGFCLLVLLVHARAAQHGKAAQGKGGAARDCGAAGLRDDGARVRAGAWKCVAVRTRPCVPDSPARARPLGAARLAKRLKEPGGGRQQGACTSAGFSATSSIFRRG